jgi:hypothetical protein
MINNFNQKNDIINNNTDNNYNNRRLIQHNIF